MGRLMVFLAATIVGCGGAPFGVLPEMAADDGGVVQAVVPIDGGTDVVSQHDSAGQIDHRVGEDAIAANDTGLEAAPPTDAPSEAAPDAPNQVEAGGTCVTDLSGVGAGDFRIAFTLITTAHADVAIISQRVGCDQSSILWGVSLNYNGQIAAATDDGLMTHWAATTEANSVADGTPHAIVFARTSGKIWISRDGVVDSIPVDDPYSLGALAPLRIGTDDCSNFWSAQRAGAVISDVCISEP